MEHSSGWPKTGINASTESFPLHEVFHLFFSDDSKQDYITNTSHNNRLIELIKGGKWRNHYVQYVKIRVVVQSNIDVPCRYTLCQLYLNFTQL